MRRAVAAVAVVTAVAGCSGGTGKHATPAPRPAPRPAVSAENSVAKFVTRALDGGADRSVAEVDRDIRRATDDMKRHGIQPGSAEFAKEQGALRRAALKNLRFMLQDHQITVQSFLETQRRVIRIPTS